MTAEQFKSAVLPLKSRLFALAYRLLEQAEDAEDVVQDIMVRIWEQKQALEEYRNIEAYAMTLVRNKAYDRIKYNKLRRGATGEEETADEFAQDPEQGMEKAERLQHVRNKVRSLPDAQREILILRDFVGYTYQDIAEIQGTDLNRVKVGIHRARKALKAILIKEKGYGLQSA